MRKRRQNISWKTPPSPHGAGPKLPMNVPYPQLPTEKIAEYGEALIPGHPWVIASDGLQPILHDESHLYPYPVLGYYYPPWVGLGHGGYNAREHSTGLRGDLIIYAGTVRVSERPYREPHTSSHTIRSLYHTFIVGTGRYIIPDLNTIEPLH